MMTTGLPEIETTWDGDDDDDGGGGGGIGGSGSTLLLVSLYVEILS